MASLYTNFLLYSISKYHGIVFHVLIWTILIYQETSEVKRKNAKRTFKSEKEFLEFTLKYQQVIAERDSGN